MDRRVDFPHPNSCREQASFSDCEEEAVEHRKGGSELWGWGKLSHGHVPDLGWTMSLASKDGSSSGAT